MKIECNNATTIIATTTRNRAAKTIELSILASIWPSRRQRQRQRRSTNGSDADLGQCEKFWRRLRSTTAKKKEATTEVILPEPRQNCWHYRERRSIIIHNSNKNIFKFTTSYVRLISIDDDYWCPSMKRWINNSIIEEKRMSQSTNEADR